MSMRKKEFLHSMKPHEKVFGWIYLFIHTFAISYFLTWLNQYVLPRLGWQMSSVTANVVCYCIGLVLILIFMFHFMRTSFHDLCDNKLATLEAIVLGYVIYYLLSLLVSFLLSFLLDNQVNPNSQAVSDLTALNPDAIKAVAILLAPIVEEVLFRGVLFGTVRKKSRIFAYILSTVAFAFYHLWQYFLTGFSWHLLLYMLQYVPASIALAWSYEKGRSIWSPVFLHMIMNFLTISIDIGLR